MYSLCQLYDIVQRWDRGAHEACAEEPKHCKLGRQRHDREDWEVHQPHQLLRATGGRHWHQIVSHTLSSLKLFCIQSVHQQGEDLWGRVRDDVELEPWWLRSGRCLHSLALQLQREHCQGVHWCTQEQEGDQVRRGYIGIGESNWDFWTTNYCCLSLTFFFWIDWWKC